ncbi:TonB-dependent receptor plug domain-containing protein, partial [Brevundimonas sp.]|uniref:TonB-dependent receptor plug domain-containing protein n=1 Tax=Brevundimonas sp. TaxID=1871086 RepID=UPI003918CEB6
MISTRKLLFGTTVLAGIMSFSAPALAQSVSSQDEQATQVEEIVVTGSRIRRDPTNSATPLIQVAREDLLTTGQTTVIDYLATIPALSNSLVPSDTTGSGLNDGGLSLPNLRSLGSGRTLTLVDGRRHVGAGQGSLAVDIDSIPRLLIENIEIVTGGASSVYGADAVSGVLNFVLRKDFEGLEIDANYGQIVQGGVAANNRVSALAGINLFDDRLNLYAHAEWDRNDEVQSLDIDWIEDAWILIGNDADPAATPFDSTIDNLLYSGLRRLDRPRWGQTTLANAQQPSALNNPLVP